jgi:hypothetical protein
MRRAKGKRPEIRENISGIKVAKKKARRLLEGVDVIFEFPA